jgi:hypothetical protein
LTVRVPAVPHLTWLWPVADDPTKAVISAGHTADHGSSRRHPRRRPGYRPRRRDGRPAPLPADHDGVLRKLSTLLALRDASGRPLGYSHSHRLRHAKATTLLNAGVPLIKRCKAQPGSLRRADERDQHLAGIADRRRPQHAAGNTGPRLARHDGGLPQCRGESCLVSWHACVGCGLHADEHRAEPERHYDQPEQDVGRVGAVKGDPRQAVDADGAEQGATLPIRCGSARRGPAKWRWPRPAPGSRR